MLRSIIRSCISRFFSAFCISNDQALKFTNLYKRLFPVLLRLAVDVEQVARQLFDPLTRQLIHWFTNNVSAENKDTMALLDAATDAVGHPSDGALREFSAQCLGEFLKWSLKQAPPAALSTKEKAAAEAAGAPATNPMNIKSLLRRLYSLAHHPNPYKRLGACLTFNQV
jgi:DNA-dependent protein kinase catalytic subunit